MIKTNLFRVYNSKTYEKVDKLGTNYTNQFFDDDNILSPDEKNIIICGSYYMCNCLNSNSLRVFEGDILRVVERDIRMGEYTETIYEGMVVYKDDKYMLEIKNIGYIDLEDNDSIVDFEFVDNYYEIQRKLYKIKELFENYFVSSHSTFSVFIKEDDIIISNENIVFIYVIKEERLKNTISRNQINYNDKIQSMLLHSCIDYLRKEITKIWEKNNG